MEKLNFVVNRTHFEWDPEQIDTNLKGSEECVVYLATELSKYFDVSVFKTGKEKKTFRNVRYLPLQSFNQAHLKSTKTIFFKNTAFLNKIPESNKNCYLWSSEINRTYNTKNLQKIIYLTKFHERNEPFVVRSKKIIFPHGIDIDLLDKFKSEKKDDFLLYCSCPNRGILDFLELYWEDVKKKNPSLKLKISYSGDNNLREYLKRFKDVELLGELSKSEFYKILGKAKYWFHPLNNPRSELYCLNAVKAQYMGAAPVVNKIGALKETVGKYHDAKEFLIEKKESIKKSVINLDGNFFLTWSEVAQQFWIPLLNGSL